MFILLFVENVLPIARAQSEPNEVSKTDKNKNGSVNEPQKVKSETKTPNKVSSKSAKSQKKPLKKLANKISDEEKIHPIIFFFVVILILLISSALAYFWYYKNSAKAKLKKNYNRFEVNESTHNYYYFLVIKRKLNRL